MAASFRERNTELLQVPRKFKDRDITPERTKVWVEPKPKNPTEKKVPVVYYLSRNGHLEQPHFMEVPLSSPEGLYLRGILLQNFDCCYFPFAFHGEKMREESEGKSFSYFFKFQIQKWERETYSPNFLVSFCFLY